MCSTIVLPPHKTTTTTIYSAVATSTTTIYPNSGSIVSSAVDVADAHTSVSMSTFATAIPTIASFSLSTYRDGRYTPCGIPAPSATGFLADAADHTASSTTATPTPDADSGFPGVAIRSNATSTTVTVVDGPSAHKNTSTPTHANVCVGGGSEGVIYDCGSYSTAAVVVNATGLVHPIPFANVSASATTTTAGVTGTAAPSTTDDRLNGGYSGAVASFVGAGERVRSEEVLGLIVGVLGFVFAVEVVY